MKDGSPAHFGDGCSNLAKFSRGRNKNFPNTFLPSLGKLVQVTFSE